MASRMRWSRALRRSVGVCLVVLVSATLGACSSEGNAAVEWPTAEEQSRPPYAAGAEIGETYDFVLSVHCGVEWARINGAQWKTQRQEPVSEGGDRLLVLYDKGSLTLVSETEARYVSDEGFEATFEPTDQTPPGCA